MFKKSAKKWLAKILVCLQVFGVFTYLSLSYGTNAVMAADPIIIDHTCTNLDSIPAQWIENAKSTLHIAYGHTSHGSQLTTGMTGLVSYKGSLYAWNRGGTNGALDLRDTPFSGASDLGNPNRTQWATSTRTYLDNNPDINVIIWSWCGQVSSATEADINTYLDLMSSLERDYPNVRFVYMTGHLDGTGVNGNLHRRNEQIRNYCNANGKILFDFADIESYAPDGHYVLDKMANDNCDYDSDGNGTRDKNWAIDWQNANPRKWYNCSSAHSQPLNANLKAYGAWWLWSRLAGWDGTGSVPTETPSSTVTPTSTPAQTPSPTTSTPIPTSTLATPSHTPTPTATSATPTSTPTPTPLTIHDFDLNNDGAINMTDIMLVIGSFNSVQGDLKYNEKYDFNHDGAINMADIMMLIKYFNQIVPTPSPTPTSTITPSTTPTSGIFITPGLSGRQVVASASRVSGVAPLMVHFTADSVGAFDGGREFHHFDYTWDFGDTQSGNWPVSGKAKNTAKGAVAAHVFEKPGTYTVNVTVKDLNGEITTDYVTVHVDDPEVVYAGTKTTCISDNDDFTGAPPGSRHITTSDLSTITQYATSGSRILLRRGSQWTTQGLNWPNNEGPVTIGAFGEGINPDERGIFENAPSITVNQGQFMSLTRRQDWRIMDICLKDPTRLNTSLGGAIEMQRLLLFRLKVKGFETCLGWSSWNSATLMPIDQMAVVSCDLSDAGVNIFYGGSERLVLLGNDCRDARTSHVVRVWQGYKSVISHNAFSGSSLDNTAGRHALKFHGPGENFLSPAEGNGHVHNRSQYTVISDNLFGGSGPWPINVAPQNGVSDERISHIIFEGNTYHAAYGNLSSRNDTVMLRISGQNITVRNNIFDGSGISDSFLGIHVAQNGIEPSPINTEIYNNTLYKKGKIMIEWNKYIGVRISEDVRQTIVKNNLVSFPDITEQGVLIENESPDLQESNNLKIQTAGFIDPDNADVLKRDFRLLDSSPAITQGINVPVFEDKDGTPRTQNSTFDVGAYEFE